MYKFAQNYLINKFDAKISNFMVVNLCNGHIYRSLLLQHRVFIVHSVINLK